MAKAHPLVKFLKIKARHCIEKIKDHDIPAMLIFKGGEIVKQFIPTREVFMGLKANFHGKSMLGV